MAGSDRSVSARTFTEALRTAGQDALAALFRARPDLQDPLPVDLAELAARATATGSVARAIDQLNAWQRQVLLALAVLPDPVTADTVAGTVGAPGDATTAAIADLRRLALVWGPDDDLHLIRAAREQFGSYPAGLAPATPVPLTVTEIDRLLAELEPAGRAVLEKLVWAPAGSVAGADRPVSVETARSPVERLLARRLLRPVDSEHVLLPREVAWRMRQERLTPQPVEQTAPAITTSTARARLVDNGAAGAAQDLLHDVDLVVHAVEAGQLRLLRSGGIGQRDVAALTQSLGTDPAHVAFVIEAAYGSGLVAADGASLAVTTAYDRWRSEDSMSRWRWIASAWIIARRTWSPLDGAHVLGPEGELPRLADLRPLVVDLAFGGGPAAAPALDELVDAAAWHRPGLRRIAGLTLADATRLVWRELGWLGATGMGAVSALAGLLADPGASVPAKVADLFPDPVDRVVIQSDLTAVAAGPPAHRLATDLRLLADQESRGTGGVYRFTAASLRRAFDAGWSAADVRSWLERHSSSPIPQALAYLVDDVARRHGDIRVGSAGSYLSVADDSQIAALLAHPGAEQLGLRRVGPGVVVSFADPDDVVAWLRRSGHSPTAEDAYGRRLTSPGPHRVKAPSRSGTGGGTTPEQAAAAVLAGFRPRAANGNGQSTAEALLVLTRATQQARPIRVAYVGTDGTPVERSLSPLDLDGGRLRAVDTDGAQVVSIPLSRISKIRTADDPDLE